ncbi:epoxide hydrolase N-terminal domain-containing protein [Nocardia sp. NBC_01730]|uniref:epoxide hydrolase N-terminal domain-containing protein n=1 Tax=Nocardia sp. NBC_01730 TaxID=2975998 RepID=UPI003FA3BD13
MAVLCQFSRFRRLHSHPKRSASSNPERSRAVLAFEEPRPYRQQTTTTHGNLSPRCSEKRPFPLQPSAIQVSDEVLTDFRRRLELTHWPLDGGNADGYCGVPRSYLQKLVEYWPHRLQQRRGCSIGAHGKSARVGRRSRR